MAEHSDHALSFGPAAGVYDARRPGYPEQALGWALGGPPVRVVDLGAGTGILTRLLMRLGYATTAVEPDPAMRERLIAGTPDAHALAGSAEAIPLPDSSADAVTAGQAYHWFDRDRAHPEIARVLRPGGVFAPVWNVRDETVPWVVRLSEIIDGTRGRPSGERRGGEGMLTGEFTDLMDDRVLGPLFGPLFGTVQRRVFRHAVPMDAESLVALITTRSYYLTAAPEARTRIERRVRELAAELPETFDTPYLTAVYRAQRL